MKKLILMLFLASSLLAVCQTPEQKQTIDALDSKLKKGALNITRVLTDPQWMALHSLTAFREIIKQNAKAEKIKLTPPGEPGLNTTIKGQVTDHKGKTIPGALVYVYHTSAKGWYSDTAAHVLMNEGDMRHARLFGYLKTDQEGKFEFETIRPEGYPKSDLPAHIHISIWSADGQPLYGMPGELLFEEDKRLTPERKQEAVKNGFLVSKNVGTDKQAVYLYLLVQEE